MDSTQPRLASYPYIPASAFLYFPPAFAPHPLEPTLTCRQLYDHTPYTPAEQASLLQLDQAMQKQQLLLEEFNRASRLRYLLSNDSDVDLTLTAMKDYASWKKTHQSIDPNIIDHLLKQGAMYFSGRDEHYRPILIVNSAKLTPQDQNAAVAALDYLINYMADVLLIEGQIENFVLIVNLAAYTVDLRSLLLRLLTFSSHYHPGRLHMCYMLSTPAVLSWNWHPITRKIVTEETLSRISLTGEKNFEGIWEHISKDIMERSYGGHLGNISDNFWPPRQLLMERVPDVKQHHISAQEYLEMYKQGKFAGKKVKKSLVGIREEAVEAFAAPPVITTVLDIESQQSEIHIDLKHLDTAYDAVPIILNHDNKASNKVSNYPSNENRQNWIRLNIKGEKSFIKEYRSLKTFFRCDPFLMAVGDKPRPQLDS